MAPSDISLSSIGHHSHVPARTAGPLAPRTTPAASAASAASTASTAAPSFTAVFASIAAAAAAAGTTEASTVAAPSGSTVAASASTTPAAASATPAVVADGPAGPLFGANPWLTDPTGSGPGPVTNYNPIYFATEQTAETVAQMAGGTVVSMQDFTSAPGSPFQQNEPNLMVQLPNGGLVNPGLIADIYSHGWNQAFTDQQVANEFAGAAPADTNG
jgi:hypothetical protein